MIDSGCQISVFRFTAQIRVGSPPKQNKMTTEMLKQKYELIEGIVCRTLTLVTWAEGACFKIHAFQLVHSFFLLLSLLCWYPASLPFQQPPRCSVLFLPLPLNFLHPQYFSWCFLHLQLPGHEEPQRGAPFCSGFAVRRPARAADSIQQASAGSSGLPRSGSWAVHRAGAELLKCWNGTTEGVLEEERSGAEEVTWASITDYDPAAVWQAQLQPSLLRTGTIFGERCWTTG